LREKESSAARNYFLHSPFRSRSFVASTVVVALEVGWGLRMMYLMHGMNTNLSDVTFVLSLIPAAVWVYSLFLHREIRNVMEPGTEVSSYSRLHVLHSAFPAATAALMIVIIIQIFIYGSRYH
jgi:hypothetical protein